MTIFANIQTYMFISRQNPYMIIYNHIWSYIPMQDFYIWMYMAAYR